MIATSLEQSSRILKCGISASLADMFYLDDGELSAGLYYGYSAKFSHDDIKPAWSLNCLIGFLPEKIDSYFLCIYPKCIDRKLQWCVSYSGSETLILINSSDLIESAVSMIEWLVGNGYKL